MSCTAHSASFSYYSVSSLHIGDYRPFKISVIMNHLLPTIAILLIVSTISSQSVIDKYYDDVREQDNITAINVRGLTFSYIATVLGESDDEDREEIKDFIASITSFELLVEPELTDARDKYNAGLDRVSATHDELMNIKDPDGRFSFLIDEEDGIVYELVGLGAHDDEFIVFSLVGEMPLDLLSQAISKIQSDDMKVLQKLSDNKVSQLKVFPNPVGADNTISLEIPEGMKGGKVQLIDSNGAVVKSWNANEITDDISTYGLNPGYYIISITHDTVNMKKKVLIVR